MSAVVLGEVWLRVDVVWLRTGAGAGRMMGVGWESYSRTRNPAGQSSGDHNVTRAAAR